MTSDPEEEGGGVREGQEGAEEGEKWRGGEGAVEHPRAPICCHHTDGRFTPLLCDVDSFRDDVLPCRVYLRHCVLAAKKLSPDAYDNFLDNTFLSDRKTTIRCHLAANPEIMEELPPPELAGRYSG